MNAATITPPRARRVLFFAEAVTLAHVARPHVLAQALCAHGYRVLMARDPRYGKLFEDAKYGTRDIHTIGSGEFSKALKAGQPIYTKNTLRDYIREDLQVIDEFAPDLIVGDFRLSLAVSAQLAGTPYMSVTNAYWSPFARTRFAVPEIPLVRALGVRAADAVFQVVRPAAFAWHTRPLNAVLSEFGFTGLGTDLRQIYTHADHTLYADVPELVPTFDLPPNHHYLGPVLWSPDIAMPAWKGKYPSNLPVVYVNLGSSGSSDLFPIVLEALSQLPVVVMAATAGHKLPPTVPHNAFLAQYLPGDKVAAEASLVICNGGSPATQQAAAAGVPVLGIAGNLDQYANMHFVQKAGTGVLVRQGLATVARLRSAVRDLLSGADYPGYVARAVHARQLLRGHDAPRLFTDLVDKQFTQAEIETHARSHQPALMPS